MTTLFLHIIGAFVCLAFLNRLYDFEMPVDQIFLLSLAAILPDVIDKTLTGTRYPFHSLLVSGFFLIALNLIVRYYSSSHTDFRTKYPKLSNYFLLASIAFLTHPILDLEGFVPLFYPLDLRGYQLDFNIVLIQSVPPKISDFSLGFIIESFDYAITYENEGTLISTFDALLVFLMGVPIILKGLQKIIISKNNME
ncbi:MAG: metal-dependent hydrolase [Candidatus Thorarchaeota archaeon]